MIFSIPNYNEKNSAMEKKLFKDKDDNYSDNEELCLSPTHDSSLSAAKIEPETTMLGKKENKEVKLVKHFLFLVLVISIIGAFAIYLHTRHSERSQFEAQFYDDANKVLGSIGSSVERVMGSLDSLSMTIVTVAHSTNQTFPFVAVPQFGMHVAKTMPFTGAIATYYNPIVKFDQRLEWEHFASRNNTSLPRYVDETLHLQDEWDNFYGPMPQNYSWPSHDVIYGDDLVNGGLVDIPYNVSRPGRLDLHMPVLHTFPLIMTRYYPANWDYYHIPNPQSLTRMFTKRKAVLSEPFMMPRKDSPSAMAEAGYWCAYVKDLIPPKENCMEPMSNWIYPIIDNVNHIKISDVDKYEEVYEVKASIITMFYWRTLFKDILPQSSKGIILVVQNSCVPSPFTYQIDGPSAIYLGVGDFHDKKYSGMVIKSDLIDLHSYRSEKSMYTGVPPDDDACVFTFTVYPSDKMKDQFETNKGIIFAVSALAFIILPFLVFLAYDRIVSNQQEAIMSNAQRSDDIINSLFPATVREKLYNDQHNNGTKSTTNSFGVMTTNLNSAPIAELYPETTVLFADIANFTAWSSVRDPFQVFNLLEGIYGAFDELVEQNKIFKVETIGDCYVAVAGLPDRRRDHAVVMSKVAKQMVNEMASVTSELENTLGPGTAKLSIRIGLNSGPTMAGVLRGKKGRFQLFGDTVNTAARMESNSFPGRILCSQKTADILTAVGKQHWVTPRMDLVVAKGKGSMQCYWINPKNTGNGSTRSHSTSAANESSLADNNNLNDLAEHRQISWLSELIEGMLIDIVSSRRFNIDVIPSERNVTFSNTFTAPIDEVSETILIPKAKSSSENKIKQIDVQLSPSIKEHLYKYIKSIAKMYGENPFHNFEHASHVVMSTKKLLSRVIKPDYDSKSSTAYGIASDPLIQFAIIFSALIHDVDHPGVSNSQLVKEKTEVATLYNNKSVAEQNSITIAWRLLMQPEFKELKDVIMPRESEFKLFRQLLVNSVMATDLFDMDLRQLRESRWKKVFDDDDDDNSHETSKTSLDEDSNRRATIVIEHIIQASDVSHTMQHWHVYQEWNYKLYKEMYISYISGRADKDPGIGWYNGELWFFDNYIIPLAKKLKTCGVFGVSCDELLDYAIDNRDEWANKGQSIVETYKQSMKEYEIGITKENKCKFIN